MAAISPRTQALIDRLDAVVMAPPQVDAEAVERAFNRQLAVLGLPVRPIRHIIDATSGYRHMIAMADAASRPEATRAAQEAARSTWYRPTLAYKNAAHGLALHVAREACSDPALEEAMQSAYDAASEAAGDRAEALSNARAAVGDAARERMPGMFLLEAKWAARDAIWQAAGSLTEDDIWSAAYHIVIDDAGALTDAITACEEIDVLAAFNHPAQRRLVDIWLPMLEAFEAGLFFSWITPSEVVWVPRPSMSIVDGHLHRGDGPAVEWATGERYWFWRGASVRQWVIEEPSRITPAAIHAETNEDVQRCMRERLGDARAARE
jgi:hypothetical protein